jgi:hypothetical protein
MNAATKVIETQIRNAYSGNFEKDGITYSVTVSVTSTVYSDAKAANASGAMNVIRISPSDAHPGGSSFVDPGSLLDTGPDTGTWSIKDILSPQGAVPAHEFVHLLGVSNADVPNRLATGIGAQRSSYATYDDYHWIFDQAIDRHREWSRLPNAVPLAILNKAPAGNGFNAPQSFTSKQILRAFRMF